MAARLGPKGKLQEQIHEITLEIQHVLLLVANSWHSEFFFLISFYD